MTDLEASAAADDAAGVIAQRIGGREPRAAKCRRHAEQQAGEYADGSGECKHTPVHRHVDFDDLRTRRQHGDDRATAPARDQQPRGGADRREHDAFDQQLPDQAPASRAERQPHGELLASCHRLREQQVGHVRARDRQDQADDTEQHIERPRIAITEIGDARVARDQHQRLLQVLLKIDGGPVLRQRRLAQLRQEVAQARLGLFLRLSGRQPSENRQPPVAAPIERAFLAANDRLGAERRRDVEGAADLQAEEIAVRDADDRERVAVEVNRFSDHVRAAAILALPEAVTEDRHRSIRSAAAPVIVGREETPDVRRYAERVEEPPADEEALRVARLAAGVQVEARVAVGADADQHRLVIADVLPLRIGQRGVRAANALEPQDHQPIGLVHRQRLEDQRVDQREDRDIGADAQRQRQKGHAADNRRLPHLPDGEFQVPDERRHKSHGPFDGQILPPVGRICSKRVVVGARPQLRRSSLAPGAYFNLFGA